MHIEERADESAIGLVPAPEREQRLRDHAPRWWVRALARLTIGGALSIIVLVVGVWAWSNSALTGAIGSRAFVVTSDSMSPELRAGDIAVVRGVSPERIVVGDVITARRDGANGIYVSHRVVRVERTTDGALFFTKGDANPSVDESPVDGSQIAGRVVDRVPGLGGFVLAFTGGRSLLLLLVLAIVLALAALKTGRVRLRPDHRPPGAGPTTQRERKEK